jgi:hypothetical protein
VFGAPGGGPDPCVDGSSRCGAVAGALTGGFGASTHTASSWRYPEGLRSSWPGERKGKSVFHAIADVLRQIGGAVATVVTLPFRAVARLFGGASGSARGHRA